MFPETFLRTLYPLCAQSKTSQALDLVYRTFDTWLATSSFEVCEEVLNKADLSRLDVATALGLLINAWHAQESIGNYTAYFDRVYNFLLIEKERDPIEIETGLLIGLFPIKQQDPFCSQLYSFCKKKQDKKALSLIFETFHDLVINKFFEECNRLLGLLDANKLNIPVNIAILSNTWRIQQELYNYVYFYCKVVTFLEKEGKSTQEIKGSLLKGLEPQGFLSKVAF